MLVQGRSPPLSSSGGSSGGSRGPPVHPMPGVLCGMELVSEASPLSPNADRGWTPWPPPIFSLLLTKSELPSSPCPTQDTGRPSAVPPEAGRPRRTSAPLEATTPFPDLLTAPAGRQGWWKEHSHITALQPSACPSAWVPLSIPQPGQTSLEAPPSLRPLPVPAAHICPEGTSVQPHNLALS